MFEEGARAVDVLVETLAWDLGFRAGKVWAYNPPEVTRKWLWVCYSKIPRYTIFDLLNGDCSLLSATRNPSSAACNQAFSFLTGFLAGFVPEGPGHSQNQSLSATKHPSSTAELKHVKCTSLPTITRLRNKGIMMAGND